MFERVVVTFTNYLGRRQVTSRVSRPGTAASLSPEIVFNPLDPVDPAQSAACQCPVTRQTLKQGDRVFQCRACLMAYSEAGWEFLQQENKGCCCGCGGKKTILLFVASMQPTE